jgi:DNA-binding transcriptional LysR family regulator
MKPRIPAVLADLQLLTVLAQTRSFTQAGLRLNVSKASVSARIKDLEQTVGVPLVRRTTRSVTLTEAGLRLVDDTQASFAQIEQSFLRARDSAGAPSGLLRVTAPVAFGRQWIAELLPAFLRQYPDIRIEIALTDRVINLAQEGFDLAIRHTQLAPDTHVATVLCASGSLLVASPAYLASRGTPMHPQELTAHDCLLYLRENNTHVWSFEREQKKSPGKSSSESSSESSGKSTKSAKSGKIAECLSVQVGGPLKANNSEVLREAVLSGLGIGLLPDFSALDEVRAGRLVLLLPDWTPVGFFGAQIYAIRPWTPVVPRAVRCLVDYLRASLSGGF